MSRFGQAANGATVTSRTVQSASPADLTNRVNAAIAALGDAPIISISLAGAGDGHQFAVMIESVALDDLIDGGLDSAVCRAFLASEEGALERARAAISVAQPVADLQVAGASSGLTFMGLLVGGELIIPLETFDGDVELLLNRDAHATYSGPAAAVSFTRAVSGHREQRVKSYLIPAGTATSLNLAADLNVNQITPFDVGADYLLTFAFFSGTVVGTGRQVV